MHHESTASIIDNFVTGQKLALDAEGTAEYFYNEMTITYDKPADS